MSMTPIERRAAWESALEMEREHASMRELLEYLDRRGGLGLDVHDMIRKALGRCTVSEAFMRDTPSTSVAPAQPEASPPAQPDLWSVRTDLRLGVLGLPRADGAYVDVTRVLAVIDAVIRPIIDAAAHPVQAPPREPTEQMIDVGFDAYMHQPDGEKFALWAAALWTAMYDAWSKR